jgi:hypothetical protein
MGSHFRNRASEGQYVPQYALSLAGLFPLTYGTRRPKTAERPSKANAVAEHNTQNEPQHSLPKMDRLQEEDVSGALCK